MRANIVCAGLAAISLAVAAPCAAEESTASPLAGTQPLHVDDPLDELMVDGISQFAIRELEGSQDLRDKSWAAAKKSKVAFVKEVELRRERFRTLLGAVDPREAASGFQLFAEVGDDGAVGRSGSATAYAVRWRVMTGITGEGLLLKPDRPPVARVVAVPDADWTPEMYADLRPGLGRHEPAPSQLAFAGVEVLIPTLISRESSFSGNPLVAFTNEPHREFVYRQAFPVGRHIIGYEVEKILAAVDEFERRNERERRDVPIGVMGVGEGGLLALDAAAIDLRINAALVSGYFQKRSAVWREPIYRNVWAQLTEFGDAEIAGLIAPRTLVVEASAVPEVTGPPAPREGQRNTAAPGIIKPCALNDVESELGRAKSTYALLGVPDQLKLVVSDQGIGPSGTVRALKGFLSALKVNIDTSTLEPRWRATQDVVDPVARQQRQMRELTEYSQRLMRLSPATREEFWAKADSSSIDAWKHTTEFYRDYVWEEMIGKLAPSTVPPNVRTRQVFDEPDYTGYEVAIDLYPDVIAAGIMLLPKKMKEGEKRPVIVCQHGLEGVPRDTIAKTGDGFKYYQAFAEQLVQKGFIVYAPQNPYRGGDQFRVIQRQSNPLKRSLFSYIIAQHDRTVEWLSTLPYVDSNRIALYGLSYGGKTAMRVPTLLNNRYALAICSGDFNDWIRKVATVDESFGYIYTGEYEMPEWNLGNVASYAELAGLMAPRPFMVERGHDDGVAPDEWVGGEFARVRRLYDRLGISDRAEIEFFNGPHMIHGVGSFKFLQAQLGWPKKPDKP
ncbi:MAG: dienelactone hydrolase family protein [Pirellulales bacterium]